MLSFEIVPVAAAVADGVRRSRADAFGNTGIGITVADAMPGYPCRVCLRDAETGEGLLLFSYSPFDRPRPYRTVGPIFVHAERCEPYRPDGEVPEQLRRRRLALRAYDAGDTLLTGELIDGRELEAAAARLFADARVRTVHVHNAIAGCFACALRRRSRE